MFVKRLSLLKDNFPELFNGDKTVCFINPQFLSDLQHFNNKNTVVLTDDIRIYSPLLRAGYNCAPGINHNVDISIILLPRSKELAKELIIIGLETAKGGYVVIDGDKKGGIISIIKEIEKELSFDIKLSKAHGKIVAFKNDGRLLPSTWYSKKFNKINDEFVTVPGIFSWNHVDPASELLKIHLPRNLKGFGADLGAGWGFLTKFLANLELVDHIYAVDASKRALECAIKNCETSKVKFVWEDVQQWKAPKPLDFIVMNPPFHSNGKVDLELGELFITSAAKNLTKNGSLHMVSNRHLPYEHILCKHFAAWTEIGGDNKFKIFLAEKPLAVSRKKP
tara:strand:+ start:137 stop:1144 length:1008 start_codon:yes stop_codon:yes gene_type:complete